MIGFLLVFVRTFVRVMSTLLFIYCILSWILPPYNPIREWVDGLMNQFLDPIRRFLPYMGGIDFSPIILMMILNLLERIIFAILR